MKTDIEVAALRKLATVVYKQCRDCEGAYNNLAVSVRRISNISEDLEDALEKREPDSTEQLQITQLISQSRAILRTLRDVVEESEILPLPERQALENTQGKGTSWSEIGLRLTEVANQYFLFYRGFSHLEKRDLVKALELLTQKVKQGRFEIAILVSVATSSGIEDNPEAWQQLSSEIEQSNVTAAFAEQERPFIKEWIASMLESGSLRPDQRKGSTSDPNVGLPNAGIPNVGTPNVRLSNDAPTEDPPGYYSPTEPRIRDQVARLNLASQSTTDAPGYGPRLSMTSSMESPPSPLFDQDDTLLLNAQRIVDSWNSRDWKTAAPLLSEQIVTVERKNMLHPNSATIQPDVRVLKHLLAISYCLDGNYSLAKAAFQKVFGAIATGTMTMDDGDIAAAQWLGVVCIYLQEPVDAALAWAIALSGTTSKYGGSPNHGSSTLHELRMLHKLTGALSEFQRGLSGDRAKDPSTILPGMPIGEKLHIAIKAMETFRSWSDEQTLDRSTFVITITPIILMRPLRDQSAWPLPRDPFFYPSSAIPMISSLLRPSQDFEYEGVASGEFGSTAKSMVFTTKLGIEWLVDGVRAALTRNRIPWKIQRSTFLCLLTSRYKHVHFQEVYGIRFKKVALRSAHGVKITDRLYSSRNFLTSHRSSQQFYYTQNPGMIFLENAAYMQSVKQELGDKMRDFLARAERDCSDGKASDWLKESGPSTEIGVWSDGKRRLEMEDSSRTELSGEAGSSELPAAGPVAELPGEPLGSAWQH